VCGFAQNSPSGKNENIQFFRGPIMKLNIAMLVIPPFVMMFLMLIFMVL
jgi:hypothetical protein